MSYSIREQILVAIKDAIEGTYSVDGRVYRSRSDAFTRAEFPAISIEPISDQAEQVTIPRLIWTLSVRIIIFANGEIPDRGGDKVVEDMHEKLMSDLTLGGLSMDIQPVSVNFQLQESDNNSIAIICDYKVLYQTSLQNISTVN